MRNVLTGLVLVLAAGAARADIFWYTEQSATAGNVRSFDSSTDTLVATVALPAPGTEPRVAATYAITAPVDIQALGYSSSEAPILAFVDNPYVVIVDILPGSPTYATVIQTVDMRDASLLGDNPGINFLRFHPSGARIYVSGAGSGGPPPTLPSVRICRQDVGLPAATLSYSFTPMTPGHEADRLDTETDLSGEWGPMVVPEAGGPIVGIHVPWSIDISPDVSKVYFACHTEMSGVNISNVHGFTIDTIGNWVANLTITELPGTLYDHSFILAFSPSTLTYASGGSRCYVSNTSACPEPAPPPFPPSPGFVMVINTAADSNTLKIDAGVVPPALPPTTTLGVTVPSFLTPVGIDWMKTSTVAFVSDEDLAVAAPATDGFIGEKVMASITPPGSPTISDKTTIYFADPTPATDTTPGHFGVSVDNDDSEVVFCDASAGAALNHYGVDGILVASVPVTPGFTPLFITCQSGTGIGGPPGGGGGGGSYDPYDDNGAPTFSTSKSKSGGGRRSKCGLTGAEAPLLFGLWLLARRRNRKNTK